MGGNAGEKKFIYNFFARFEYGGGETEEEEGHKMWTDQRNVPRISCMRRGENSRFGWNRTYVLSEKNASFSRKMRSLEQKRQKKTLDFYVNKIYTEKAKWSEVG